MVHTLDDVERFFKETVENRDEGIVLKDLGSKWEPSDRSGKWLKLKPDYIRASSDLDVIIIGGYYGSGRHGGEVAQFLVGLAERPASNMYPRRFTSFCRVGTGLSDDELDAVVTKLKPYFRKYEYPKKAPPNFYHVTNHSKERPDVWVESPEKSLILAITSDIRTISSGTFAAPYSLRFPRIDRVRWDKAWHECLDVQSFVELVHSSNDFVNTPSDLSLDTLHKMVVENGGTFSMNLNNSVTHCVAAESKGIKFQAEKRNKDVIHYSWVLDCCSQKRLLPLLPNLDAEKCLLRRKNLHLTGLKWLEDCLEGGHKLPEDPYKLQISATADSIDEEWKDEVELDTQTVPHCCDEEDFRKVKAASEHGETSI